jgi:hypothetical protein
MAGIPTHLRINEKSPFGGNKKPSVRKTKMSEIVDKIKQVDQHLTRAVAKFRQSNGKTPSELDLMKDSTAVPLITQRKRLVKQYEYLKQEDQFAENTYKTIKGDSPIRRANQSFQGIGGGSPFDGRKEYYDPGRSSLGMINRVGSYNSRKGTLWDPRFNTSGSSVDPKAVRYYKRLTGGF